MLCAWSDMHRLIWNGSLSASPFVEEVAVLYKDALKGLRLISQEMPSTTTRPCDMLSDGSFWDPGTAIEVLLCACSVEKLNHGRLKKRGDAITVKPATESFTISKGT